MPRSASVLATLALLALLASGTASGEGPPVGARAPRENSSFVTTSTEWLRDVRARAEQAELAGDWPEAVRAWQELVDRQDDVAHPGCAAPEVVPVQGTRVYEGAWLHGHHRILRGGAPALAAYQTQFGDTADALLERALAQRDEALVTHVAERFLPLPAGRRAALWLADLCLERADRDQALAWLERLEDLEEVTTEPAEALAPWRARRIARHAAAIARPERYDAVRTLLLAAAASGVSEATRYDRVGPGDRRPPREVLTWPTTGGDASRAALPPRLGASFELAFFALFGMESPEPSARELPSPWLPPRAAVAWPYAYLNDGARLTVWDLAPGQREGQMVARHDFVEAPPLFDLADRDERGLLEGHAVTLGPEGPAGRMVYAAVADPAPWQTRWQASGPRDDHIEAVRFDGAGLEPVWRFPPRRGPARADEDLRVYGAPLLYAGRLWVAGITPTAATEDRWEAWLLGLDPETGAPEVRTYLGSGNPVRVGRPDEAIPSSAAAAHGRVVVSTALGFAAAVDARHGRIHWIYRYDRGVVQTDRARRLSNEKDSAPRPSGFVNEPPLLAVERVFLAPTDAHLLFCLFDRPRGPDRTLESRERDRVKDFPNLAVEQLVGIHVGDGAPPRLLVVGKGEGREGEPPAPMAVALDAMLVWPSPGGAGWRSPSTTGWGAAPYGRALLTAAELFVPTWHGIVVYDLADGADIALLDRQAIPPRKRELVAEDVRPYGNLVPVPGHGLLAVGASVLAFWRVR